MAKIKTSARKRRKAEPRSLPFTQANYLIFAAGIFLILIGYVALGQGPYNSFTSLSLAPVLLVIGYCVVIPAAILYRRQRNMNETNAGD